MIRKKILALGFGLLWSFSALATNLGDYAAGSTIYGKFTTYQPSTGAAFTLGGTPALSVYKDDGTTQSTAGVTLTASFDSVTGLNHYTIVTSDGFYAAGSNYDVVITTGTVDGVSVVGSVVGTFTLRKGTITGIPAATAGTSNGLLIAGTNANFDVTGNVEFADGLTINRSSSNTSALTLAGNGTGSGLAATGGATGNGFLLTGGATSGNPLATAYTSPLGAIKQFGISDSGTLASATSTTAVLRAGAGGWTVDDQPNGQTLAITQGTGLGQSRLIAGWVDSTETATVAAWEVTPDNTSEYEVYLSPPGSGGGGATAQEVWEYGTRGLTILDEDSTTIDLNSTAVGSVVGNVGGSTASVVGAVGSVTGNVGGNVAGSVGSVTGAVGSVTGNVGGNVTGSVGSVVGNVGGNVTGSTGSVVGNVGGTVNGLTATAQGNVRTALGLATANLDTQLANGATQIVVSTATSGDTNTLVDTVGLAGFSNAADLDGTYVVRSDGQRCFADSFDPGTDTIEFGSCTFTGAWSTQAYKIYPANTQ